MIWWQIVCILCIVCTVLFGIILPAYGDQYGTLGIRHVDNPVVCIFEPDPLYTDDVEEVITAAYTSISLWQEGLFKYSPDGNWRLLAITIPLEDHKYKNASQFPACNILISFHYINDENRSLGYTYINFSKSYHKYTHINIFLHDLEITDHYELDLGELEQEFTHSTFEIKPFSLIAIQNIITHEFGHALGLGHYQITDYPIYTADKPWINASIMYYAINPDSNDVAKPKYVDIKMVEKIYKEDGFGGSVSPSIKMGYYTAGDRDICTHKCSINRFI
jgi:hypothetical protein